jgi:hypothetical protein
LKKSLLLSFVAVLILLSGCSSSKESPTNNQSANKETVNKNASSSLNNNSVTKQESNSDGQKLQEVRNYIVSDIWNKGFVDISSYISTGTSSTGQKLDIDFTVQQLDKAMEKKQDYDKYMNELDSKFDSIKDIWSKLSDETDRLYKVVKTDPPKENVQNSNFDTGIFNQYMSAFIDEVDALVKQ